MATRIVPITGMTCAACEGTVADAVAALPGVDAAHADRRAGTLTLEGDRPPGDVVVARALDGTPYGVGARPWLSREHRVWRDLAMSVAGVTIAGTLLWALGLADRAQEATAGAAAGSLLVVLGLGVAASVSTCMALVGGLVVSVAAATPSHARGMARLRPHLVFNVGRIAGFAALGAAVGALGSAVAPSGLLLATLTLAAAGVMVLVGLRLTGVSPRLAAWQVSLPGRMGRWARADESSAGSGRTALLGAATFFLPCGFTQAVQLYALSTGSAAEGATVMAVFALGTAPGLLAAGVAAGAAAGAARRGSGRALHAVGVIVVAFAVVTASGAVGQLGLTGASQITATERTPNVVDDGGVQHVATTVVREGYDPAVTVIYAHEPVSWTLDPVFKGCQNAIDGSALGLAPFQVLFGPETVEFMAPEAGTYAFSCAMGMYGGEFVVIDRDAA